MRWDTTIACVAFILAYPVGNEVRADAAHPAPEAAPQPREYFLPSASDKYRTMTPRERFDSVIEHPHALALGATQWPLPYPDIWQFEVPLPEGSTSRIYGTNVLVDAQGDVVVRYDGDDFIRFFSFVRQSLALDLRSFNWQFIMDDLYGNLREEIGFFSVPRVGPADEESAPLADGSYLEEQYRYESIKDEPRPFYYVEYAERIDQKGHTLSRPLMVWLPPSPDLTYRDKYPIRTVPYAPKLYELGDGTYLLEPAPNSDDRVWFRLRSDLSSPGLDASDDHLLMDQTAYASLLDQALFVSRVMDSEAHRRGRPRIDWFEAIDIYMAVYIKRMIQLRKRS